MKSLFFRRFFFATTALILLSLFFIVAIVGFFVNDYLKEQKQNTLYDNCHSIAVAYANSDISSGYNAISDAAHALASSNGNVIFATDNSGKVVACGCDDWFVYQRCIHSEKEVHDSILKTALLTHYNGTGTLKGKFDSQYITCAIPIQNQSNEVSGAVFVSSSIVDINNLFSELAKIFLLSSFIPIILLFIIEYIISYRFIKPLKLMSDASKKMAEGDFSMKIPVNTKDEIGELSLSFNEMSAALSKNENIRKDFVANVSHELRTPMTNIGGFIDGILDGTVPKEKTEFYLNIVSSEIKRLSRLVFSMFELSKLEAGEKEINLKKFNFTEKLISIIISKEKDINDKKLTINGLSEVENFDVIADEDLIHQVLYNLVDNAIKFNKKNGYINIKLSSNDKGLVFSIANSGSIIPNPDLPYIFDRFYKIDKARSASKDSTGLGLYLVKTILDIHNGTISVNSEKDTVFTVTLPNS